jgi:hypothetical protein
MPARPPSHPHPSSIPATDATPAARQARSNTALSPLDAAPQKRSDYATSA